MKKIYLIKFKFIDTFSNETELFIEPTKNGSFVVVFKYVTGEHDILSGLINFDDNKVIYTRYGYKTKLYKWFGLFGKYEDFVIKKMDKIEYRVFIELLENNTII